MPLDRFKFVLLLAVIAACFIPPPRPTPIASNLEIGELIDAHRQPRDNYGRKWGEGSPFPKNSPPSISGGVVTWSYMPNGIDFQGRTITAINSLPNGFANCSFHDEIEDAFRQWSAVADIEFRYVTELGLTDVGDFPSGSNRIGQIRVGAVELDGVGGTAARAYGPPFNGQEEGDTFSGDIFFDVDEVWGCDSALKIGDIALHESGHSSGLDHSPEDNLSVMGAEYQGLSQLYQYDIDEIQAVYGERQGGVDAPWPTEEPTLTPTPVGSATPTPTTTPRPVRSTPTGDASAAWIRFETIPTPYAPEFNAPDFDFESAEDEDAWQDYAWYQTIRGQLENMFGGVIEFSEGMQDAAGYDDVEQTAREQANGLLSFFRYIGYLNNIDMTFFLMLAPVFLIFFLYFVKMVMTMVKSAKQIIKLW